MTQRDLLVRELALLIAIATIPGEAQAAYDARSEATDGVSTARVQQADSRRSAGRASTLPATDTYVNPTWDHDFPDPFVLFWDEKFYAYATQTRGTGFQVMESRDLVRWTHRGTALEVPWSKVHYWAPEVVHYRGKFYMTYSAENPANRKHDIGIAVADQPSGPFRHVKKLIEAGEGQRGVIDATIFFDEDGKPYIIYSEEDPRSIVLRPMAADLMGVDKERVVLLRPDRDWERGVVEAPTLVYRKGLYHLFYSAGPFQGDKQNCNYAVSHAVARNLRGPYLKRERPLLETVEDKVYGPGHQCLITTADGQMWMFYHGWNADGQPRYGSNRKGRTLRMDPVVWKGDEPTIAGPSVKPLPAPLSRVKVGVGR